jgi:hypothetical protein
MRFIFAFILLSHSLFAINGSQENPFSINFPEKQDLTDSDYITVQNLLREINIEPLLHEHYVPNQGYTTFDDLKGRCQKGIKLVLIDPEKGLFPVRYLEKIGKGSDMCLVSWVSFNNKYASLVTAIPEALRKLGFNGYFLYQVGGYPNPTGKEIQYAGVPYAFKIFMMLEAQKLGYNKVFWVDSSMLPLRDPTPLFNQLEENGAFIPECTNHNYHKKYIFPKTRELLKELTTTDVIAVRHFCTALFGLKMDAEKVEKFIESYYELVALGLPFISCFPEEFVFSAIMEKSANDWPTVPHFSVFGPFFSLRPH